MNRNKYYQKREFNAKLQYAMDAEKHKLFLEKLKEKNISLAVFVRQKIDRIFLVNSHINIDYETKKKFVKFLDENGMTFTQWIDELADSVISNSNHLLIDENEEDEE